MRCIGFNSKWISWIHQCISIVQYAVIINGVPSNYFQPTRGIRQGNPISPCLFLIVSDVLSHMLVYAYSQQAIGGFKINWISPSLTHLLFADHTLLFGQATL